MKSQKDNKIRSFFSKYTAGTFNKGDIIVKADDSLNKVFYLEKGFVRDYTTSKDGEELTLHIFVAGSFFPMMSAISGIKNRYYYEALSKVKVYSAPKEKVLEYLKKEPEIVFDLTDRLLQGMDKLLTRIEYLVFSRAESRVISSLLFLARHFGKKEGKKISIKYRFTHRDIASIAGVTRETTSRTLEKLQKNKIIEFKNPHLTINNLEVLRKKI